MSVQTYDLVVAAGDGVGNELLNAAITVLNTFPSIRFSYHTIQIGHQAKYDTGSAITEQDIELYKKYKLLLKGPLTIPSDKSAYHITLYNKQYTSANQVVRKLFQLNSNVRPCKSYKNVKTSKFNNVDIVVFRQNTEDIYTGEEHYEDNNNTAIGIKRITRQNSLDIATAAFEYAVKHKRKRITAIHKANVCRLTDGLFLQCCAEIATKYPQIEYNECLADSCLTKLMIDHTQYDTLLCPNLYGDLLSDLLAGMIGSLGLSGAAHIGSEYALFEPTHGSAPDIAGQNKVNPTSMLLSVCMLLQHINHVEYSTMLDTAIRTVIETGTHVTTDLGGSSTTIQMTDAIVAELKRCLNL